MTTVDQGDQKSSGGATADYRQDEALFAKGLERVAVAHGPEAASLAIVELERLLHGRLRVAALIIAVASTGFLIRNLLAPAASRPAGLIAVQAVAAAVIVATAVIVWARQKVSLRQLRVAEMVFFGSMATFFLFLHYEWFQNEKVIVQALRAHGTANRPVTFERLAGASTSLRWFVVIVTYGIFIPNTWRRCASVVGVMALLPIVMTVALALASDQASYFLTVPLVDLSILMLIANGIAVFGSHRIHTLQREALRAQQLGQYTLKNRLGAGGMGEVYLAEHALLRRPCAVKVVRPERAGDSDLLMRFEREVQATATLTNWNTVQIYDYGRTDDGTFYYVMEYLPGLTLEQLVEKEGPLRPGRAVYLLRQVCSALAEAHAIGLVHRDIKPSNVLVCERGGSCDVAKVVDFGLVRTLGMTDGSEKLTHEGRLVGTPAYMSPEQASGEEQLDSRTDIYSLGAVAYFVLTGQSPFVRKTAIQTIAAHLHEKPLPLTTVMPQVPVDLEAVAMRCLEKDLGQRFQDVTVLEKALASCACVADWNESKATARWRGRHFAP
jgi:serine/threonine-protein kinase